MVAAITPALEDFAEFLSKLSPRKVLNYKASSKTQARVDSLLEKNRNAGLTTEEQREMDYYMMIEHIVRLAKTRALQRITLQQQ